jgi:hypothetical protein
MILTTHALTGAVIGKYIPNPWLAVPLSLAAHFLMDSLRHGEYFDSRSANIRNTYRKVALDLAICPITLTIFFIFRHPEIKTLENMLLCAFISMVPDGLTLLHWKFPAIKILSKIKQFHSWAHRYDKFPPHAPERQWNLRNAVNDIFISFIAFLILIFF